MRAQPTTGCPDCDFDSEGERIAVGAGGDRRGRIRDPETIPDGWRARDRVEKFEIRETSTERRS